MKFYRNVYRVDDVSPARMIVPPYLVPKLCPFDYFSPKNYCTPHNSVTVWDTLIKRYRVVYKVKIMCHVQLQLLSVFEL